MVANPNAGILTALHRIIIGLWLSSTPPQNFEGLLDALRRRAGSANAGFPTKELRSYSSVAVRDSLETLIAALKPFWNNIETADENDSSILMRLKAKVGNFAEAQAMVNRFLPKPQESPSGELPCRHHWIIEMAQGPTSAGVCQKCGTERRFNNFTEGGAPFPLPSSTPKELVRLDDGEEEEEP